jgi:hypothetical protein
MTGTMRGLELALCRIHGGWWTSATPCPACSLASRVISLEAQIAAIGQRYRDDAAKRCAECRQKPTIKRGVRET